MYDNMKKCLFFIGLLVSLFTTAAPVDQATALKQAMSFLNSGQRGKASKNAKIRRVVPNLAPATEGNSSHYYIFNVGDNEGFVIVSGDDRTRQILGYSDQGAFDKENVPDGLQYLLSVYDNEIGHLDEFIAQHGVSKVRKAPVQTKASIAPLCTAMWNQAAPYNDACPISEGETEKSVTGCVATAMSIVMNYHKWPKSVPAIPAYTSSAKKHYDATTAFTVDWNNMRDIYKSGQYSSGEGNAVAQLMRAAGQAVEMNYSYKSSGAAGFMIAPALVKYFGYDAVTTKRINRNEYESQNEWNDIIYNELKEKRPVVYCGVTPSGGGHCFVCDGYAEGDYFHINWGWGGMVNGYYVISLLNPPASGIGGFSGGYSMGQLAIVGMKPGSGDTGGDEVDDAQRLTVASFSYSNSDLRGTRSGVSSNFTIFEPGSSLNPYTLRNDMSVQVNAKYGVGVYDAGGNLVAKLLESGMKTWGSGTSFKHTSQFKQTSWGAGLQPGNYKVKPISFVSGPDKWYPCVDADKYAYDMVITETSYVMTRAAAPVGKAALFVENIELGGNLRVGTAQTAAVTIKNQGTKEFSDNVNLVNYDGYTTTIASAPLTLAPGETEILTINNCVFDVAKDYHLRIARGEFNDPVVRGSKEIDVTIAPKTAIAPDVQIIVNEPDPTTKKFFGQRLSGKVVFTNNNNEEYWDRINVNVVHKNGTSLKFVSSKNDIVRIPAHEKLEVPFDLSGLMGENYYFVGTLVYQGKDPITPAATSDTYQCKAGVGIYHADGTVQYVNPASTLDFSNATAVNFEDLGSSLPASFTPSDNANCLYFTNRYQTVGASLEGKNIVKDRKAENISIDAAKDFYTPYDFTVKKIVYERTFTKGNPGNKKGWETIMLPFDVTKVTLKEEPTKQLTWFTPTNNSKGAANFWLMDFVQEDGAKVYYQHADKFEANHPYIIAVPATSSKWSNEWVLVNKPMLFEGENALVVANVRAQLNGTDYKFVGTLPTKQFDNIYKLNTAGDNFELTASATVKAFNAYFIDGGTSGASHAKALQIGFINPNGIEEITTDNIIGRGNGAIYNLNGMKVAESSKELPSLPHGIYIVNGKKIVR